MITDYEHVLICALRYALGRRTYVVGIVTEYIALVARNLSDNCIMTMIKSIKSPPMGYGNPWDENDWMCLLEQLEEEMGKRYGRCEVD